MKVLLITSKDSRKRYRFVKEALEAVDISVSVRIIDGWRIRKSPGTARLYGPYDCVVIIGGGGPLFVYDFLFFKWRLRVPVCIRLGGDPRLSRDSYLRDLFNRRQFVRYAKVYLELWAQTHLIKRSDIVFTVSDALSEQIKKSFGLSKVFTLPQTVVAKEREKEEAHQIESRLRILSVTNLQYREKKAGLVYILRALEKLSCDGTKVEWRILGGGAYANDVHDAITTFSNPDVSVNYLGYDPDVDKHYCWADAFVYASELDWMPNVLLEAKKFGLPVLLHDYKPLRAIFSRGGALFFSGRTGEGFVDGVGRLFDCNIRREMASINVKDIELQYSPRTVGELFKNALGSLL